MNPTTTAPSSLHTPHTPSVYGPQGRSAWLDVDWREHQRWVILDGQPVNVIELGGDPAQSSQPLIFVHGLSGSWPNWLEQLPVLAGLNGDAGRSGDASEASVSRNGQGRASTGFGGHRVIALDLPGFGYSPMPRERISISGYARLLDRLLDTLEIDSAAVVGNSMGGFIGAELAIAFPQRVERLVLVSAAGISTYDHRGAVRTVPLLRRAERILTAATAWSASKSDTVARRPRLRDATLNVVVRHPSRLPAALAAEQLRGSGKPGFMQALEANLNYDFRERLPEIACPTLIVWGEDDRLITARDAAVFEELIPDSRVVMYADTGHMAMLERPEAFNELLEEFLSE
jgi:pimeloyl-ACP methyl ester carboxylesterase